MTGRPPEAPPANCAEEWMGVRCYLTNGHVGPHQSHGGRYSKRVCPHGVTLWANGPTTGSMSFCGICAGLYQEEALAPAPSPERQRLIEAARAADWQQVVLNGGPPCFHLQGGRFCLRAERWDGHYAGQIHRFVSLEELCEALEAQGAARPPSDELLTELRDAAVDLLVESEQPRLLRDIAPRASALWQVLERVNEALGAARPPKDEESGVCPRCGYPTAVTCLRCGYAKGDPIKGESLREANIRKGIHE